MNTAMIRSGVAALTAAGVLALAGCGGGDTGAQGPQGPAGPAGPPGSSTPAIRVASNAAPATDAAAAAWAALVPKVTVTGVTISSPPVVSFTVTDANGAPVVGLGNTSLSSTATVAGLTNLSFALAKLVPGADGSPSKWVSYIVTTVPTKNATTGAITAAAPTRPSTDNTGTLVDNGDGSYQYTFYRDIPQIKSQVDAMTVSVSNNKADLGDLTYEPNLVHRLTIQFSGSAPGTGTNTPNGTPFSPAPSVPLENPVDAIYDFIPATGQPAASGREVVATTKCNECHRRLGGIPGDSEDSSAAAFHGSNRNETRYCVVCHTDQRKYGRGEATYNAATLTLSGTTYKVDGRTLGNMPNNIHKIHLGKFLAKKGYDYAGVKYNEVGFPQDIRNCTKCHDGSDSSTAKTAQGDNWKNVPSRLACGACHDGINFATGMGVTLADAAKGQTSTTIHSGFAHGGLAQADDGQCKNCHTADNIDVVHLPITPPNLTSGLHVAGGGFNTNSAWIASNTSRLPAGAIKVSYEIKDVSRNATTKQPVMVFRLLQNGVVTRLNDYATTAPHPVTGRREIWNNFMGAPSVYFVFAMPQDNLTAPADFNSTVSAYLRCLWNGTVPAPDPDSCTAGGTLTGPDADGWYTATLTPVIPDGAVMLTGGLGFSYNIKNTLPLTQTNLANFPVAASTVPVGTGTNDLLAGMPNATGGLIVVAPNVTKVATAGCPTSTGSPNAACVTNGATAAYVGRRPIVEDARCNKCHQELGTFTEEAFHGGQRNDGTTCSWCHVPNRMGSGSGWSADSTSFVHAIHAGAKRQVNFTWHSELEFWKVVFPGVLRQCDSCHLPGTYDFSASTSLSALPNRPFRTVASGTSALVASPSLSPYVTAGVVYGSGFSFNATTGVTTPAAPTTMVTSPITTACFSCHDSTLAKNHMEINGGSIYVQRSTALAALPETCLVCHGTGRIADIKVMHAK